jgi:4'-phosphopantetheinyl transferase
MEIPGGMAKSLFELLSPDEQERANRFKVSAPREQFVISHALLRVALAGYLQMNPREIGFRTGAHGKPELVGTGNLQFNLSHCDGAAVVAISRGRKVGIDVERIRDNLDPMELAERFFSPPETKWLRSRAPAERLPSFFVCWTGKEAYIKACGEGLSIPLASFGVLPAADGDDLGLDIYGEPERSKQWSIWQLNLEPGLRCALAVEDGHVTVRFGKWTWPLGHRVHE